MQRQDETYFSPVIPLLALPHLTQSSEYVADGNTTSPIVRLVGVGRTFGPGIDALRNVDLSLERGISYAVTGPSGSGKSTLLNIIGLLDRPTAGECYIDGNEAGHASDHVRAEWRRVSCGFVFQDFHLLQQRSVLENIMLGGLYVGQSRTERAERAAELADYVSLSPRADMVVNRLSGGEKQRVAIARALMNRPPLLLCDEPTGNLDSSTASQILSLLLSLPDITLVVVTHDVTVAHRCERTITVLDGCITVGSFSGHQFSRQTCIAGSEPAPVDIGPVERLYENLGLTTVSKPIWTEGPVETGGFGDGQQGTKIAVRETRGRPHQEGRLFSPWQLLGEAVFCVTERLRNTLFAVIGIAVGVAAMVATIGVATSAGAAVLLGFDTTEARTITAQPAHGDTLPTTGLTANAIGAIAALPGVAAVGAYTATGEALIRTLPPWDDEFDGVTVKTYDVTQGLQAACAGTVVAGRWFDDSDRGLTRVVIGAGTAAALGISRVGGGRAIFVEDDAYEVIGIMQVPAAVPFSDGIFVLAPPGGQDVQPIDGLVILANPGQEQVLVKAVTLVLDPNQTGSVSVSTPVDYSAVQRTVASDVNGLYIVLGGIAMLVGAIGIANVRLMAVFERSTEIGLRRALGATHGSVLAQFALESTIFGLVGGLAGSAGGVVAVVVIATIHGWPPVLAAWIPLAGPLAGLVVGALAGLYPAIRAARMEPISALRTTG